MNEKKVWSVITIFIELILIILVGFGCSCIIEKGYLEVLVKIFDRVDRTYDGNMFGAYLSQISLSFIVVSITTVLSDKSRNLYWENLVEYKLVEPKYRGFYDCAKYSLVALVCSSVCFLVDSPSYFFASFIINIIILVYLTNSILSIYFNIEKIKKKIEEDYNNEKDEEVRKDKLLKLKENTINALLSYDFDTVATNFKFYADNCTAGDIVYYFTFANTTNIRLFKIILVEFKKRYKKEIEIINSGGKKAEFEEIEALLKKYNVIESMDKKLVNELTKKDVSPEFIAMIESVLEFSYEIILIYTCVLAGENYIKDINKLGYTEFRTKIREKIEKIKKEEIKENELDEKYSKLIHGAEIDTFGKGIDKELGELFEHGDNKEFRIEFQRNLKHTPMRKVLGMLESAIDNGNNYFVTVFISVYQQFPIFKYMNELDEDYNNNTVFKDINNSIRKCIINNDLNKDWKGLFNDIMGTKQGLLGEYLKNSNEDVVRLDYKDIKKLLNEFYKNATDGPWWSDNDSTYVQSAAWLDDEGYKVVEVKLGEYILFTKK